MNNDMTKGLGILGLLLALGMSIAALIFGWQARDLGAWRQSIVVKGLAEKPVKADLAEWTVAVSTRGDTFAAALKNLRAERPALDRFLAEQSIPTSAIRVGGERVEPAFVEEERPNGSTRQVQKGFQATQSLVVSTRDLARIEAASREILKLKADGRPVFDEAPVYLLTTLEDVKMSLISSATDNAQKRAQEFARSGGVKVGAMRSASQGAFYILPPSATSENADYGGTYDKTTIDKIARVVVTIEYRIDR